MANNCLQTKLKASVQNDNLIKIGHIVLDCVSGSNKFVSLSCKSGYELLNVTLLEGTIDHVTSNVTLVDSTHCVIQPGGGQTGFFTPNANQYIKIDVSDFYGMLSLPSFSGPSCLDRIKYTQGNILDIRNPQVDLDLNIVSNFTACTEMELRDSNNKLSGDLSFIKDFALNSFLYMSAPANIPVSLKLSDFSTLSNMTSIILDNNKISGLAQNITALGNLKKLVTLRVQGTNVFGSLEDLAAAQVTAPDARTSGSLAVTCNGIITLNSEAVSNGTVKTITFDSSLPNGYSIS